MTKMLVGVLLLAATAYACDDLLLADGSAWHDDGGVKYNCANWYAKPGKCTSDGEKYSTENMVANDACCVCGGGTVPATPLAATSSGSCVVDNDWVHKTYKDNCQDYISGKSKKYDCDPAAKLHCCTCAEKVEVEEAAAGSCSDKKVDGADWHDEYGEDYGCEYYSAPKKNRCAKDGDLYENFGMTANEACCTCGGGDQQQCTDWEGAGGGKWHDDGGPKYNCEWYSQKASRCSVEASKYADEAGVSAKMACCHCGGGDKEEGETPKVGGEPKPDEGDDILLTGEWVGDQKFYHKKHLSGGFILYWNLDKDAKIITLALLSPANQDGWISLGFSPTGGMAGSDAFVAWFDDDGEAVITDKYLKNQSPSGILAAARQEMQGASLWKIKDRMALVVTRPWESSKGGVEIKAVSDFVKVIYSHGKISAKCNPFCNHAAGARWRADMAFTSPPGMSVYMLNRGNAGEPCQGVAKLECQEGLYCMHADAITGDIWAVDFSTYGTCSNPQDDIDDEELEKEAEYGEQSVFANNGGFENVKYLRGGFVLLWDLNKVSAPGSFGPEDTLSIAVVSTAADKQGYIAFGWSPNGEMKGSDVVIGWSDGGSNTHIGDYFLKAQISNMNFESNKQNLTNLRVFKKNGQTAMTFERALTPADSVQILEGLVHVIYAAGPLPDEDDKNYIPYHRFRSKDDVEFVPYAEDLAEANKMGLRQLCAGDGNLECKKGLTCNLFDTEMLDRIGKMRGGNSSNSSTMSRWNSTEARNTTGYTSASSRSQGGRGRRGNSSWGQMFSNTSKLVGSGMCIQPEDVSRWSSWGDAYKFQAVQAVRDMDFKHHIKLRWGFDLYWNLLDAQGTVIDKDGDYTVAESIRMALVSSIGPGWLGIGMGTDGMMLGANAVIGWEDPGNKTNTRVYEYYLMEKLPWMIHPIGSSKETSAHGMQHQSMDLRSMELTDMEIRSQGHENALIIQRPLVPTSGKAVINPGERSAVLYAVGSTPSPNDDYFGYHRFREMSYVTFIPTASN